MSHPIIIQGGMGVAVSPAALCHNAARQGGQRGFEEAQHE